MGDITLNPIGSGYNLSKINTNFDTIETSINDSVLHRSGGNNTMAQQLDMNSNKVINLPIATGGSEAVSLNQVLSIINTASTGIVVRLKEPRLIATEGQTVFNLSIISITPGAYNSQVYVNGVAQVASVDYVETNATTITFLEGLVAGDAVDVYINESAGASTETMEALSLVSDIRAADYSGKRFIQIVSERGNPSYYLDSSDTVSADDDFLVVVDAGGNRWKLVHDYTINIEHAGCSATPSFDNTAKLQAIADFMGTNGGGLMYVPAKQYEHTGITLPTNVGIIGAGWGSILLNTNTSGGFGIKYAGVGVDTTSTDRNTGQFLWNFACLGNALSGEGIVFELIGATDNGTLDRKPSVAVVNHVQIKGHGDSGVRFGKTASFGAGNKLSITDCAIQYNGNKGVEIVGQSNTCNISNNVINNNTSDGVYMNFVASTNCIEKNQFMDNGGYGVYAFSCEEPFVLWNGFNRNSLGAVVFSGNGTKSTEAGVILGNLFGDNGSGAGTQREISITYTKGSSVLANYFYGTGQDTMIYLSDYADGISIRDNHWKDLTTETKLELKVGITGSFYTFEDSNSEGSLLQRLSSKVIENQQTSALTIFRNRAIGNTQDFFNLKASGEMNWGSGSAATDVKLSRVNAGALRTTGSHEVTSTLDITDGITAPSTKTGYARIYVDTADGDLKVKFSDGVVKTIVTDV